MRTPIRVAQSFKGRIYGQNYKPPHPAAKAIRAKGSVFLVISILI